MHDAELEGQVPAHSEMVDIQPLRRAMQFWVLPVNLAGALGGYLAAANTANCGNIVTFYAVT
jgi:hypothetical protein